MPTQTLTYNLPPLPATGTEQTTVRFDEAYAILCTGIIAGLGNLQSRDGTMVIERDGSHMIRVVVEEHGAVLADATVEGEEGKSALCKVLDVITPQFAEPKSTVAMHEYWNEGGAARMVYRLTFPARV